MDQFMYGFMSCVVCVVVSFIICVFIDFFRWCKEHRKQHEQRKMITHVIELHSTAEHYLRLGMLDECKEYLDESRKLINNLDE